MSDCSAGCAEPERERCSCELYAAEIGRVAMQRNGYAAFLKRKHVNVPAVGITVEDDELNVQLFPFQREIVRWALARGRAAIFADCGFAADVESSKPSQTPWRRSHECG